MKKNIFITTLLLTCIINSYSQVGIGTTNPDPSSILDIESTTQGFLPPRMTTTQINAIVNPAEGLFVYNTDTKCFQFFNGTAWSNCLTATPPNSLDCSSITVNGAYTLGNALNKGNTITISVLVSTLEAYTFNTNTVNGYSFSGTGTFTNLGLNTITLSGTGTPLTTQTDIFTITFAGKSDTCNATVNITAIQPNCLAYLNAGFTTDGIYPVDPDGTGGNPSYDCYCDMTNDGGGWTLVFNHDTAGGYWTDATEASEFNITSPGLSTNKYSIISKIGELKTNAPFEFRLHYPGPDLTNHWSQTFDPRSGGSPGRPVVGYTPINIEANGTYWGGIEFDSDPTPNTYLDGSVDSGRFHYSIGAFSDFMGGFRGPEVSVVYNVQLFIR